MLLTQLASISWAPTPTSPIPLSIKCSLSHNYLCGDITLQKCLLQSHTTVHLIMLRKKRGNGKRVINADIKPILYHISKLFKPFDTCIILTLIPSPINTPTKRNTHMFLKLRKLLQKFSRTKT